MGKAYRLVRTPDEAVAATRRLHDDYEARRQAARAATEEYFDVASADRLARVESLDPLGPIPAATSREGSPYAALYK